MRGYRDFPNRRLDAKASSQMTVGIAFENVHKDLVELYKDAMRSAWNYAHQNIKKARQFKDPGFRNFFIKKAEWHRAHAKQLRRMLQA